MARSIAIKVGVLVLVLMLVAALAPIVSAQGPTPSGSYSLTYYNYVTDEAPSCASDGIAAGTESAVGTFHFWPEWTSPYSGVTVNNYSACWDGWLTFPSYNNWFVQATHDDGMDIWVDGNITMRAWYDTGPSTDNGTFTIDPNVPHRVVIKYYNRTLGGTACIGWGVQGMAVSYWNCPSLQTTTYTPVYYPTPVVPAYTYTYGYPTYQYVNPQTCPWCYYNVPPTPVTGYCSYYVQTGDTLGKIAALYNTNYFYLAQINNLSNPNLIYSGTRLNVPCR